MKKFLLRTVGVTVIAILALATGIQNSQADAAPYITLTNSNNNWTVQTGTQLSFTAQVYPLNYRTLNRIEIREGNSVLASCSIQNTCYYSLSSVKNGTTFLQAVGYDVNGTLLYSQVMSLQGVATYNNGYNNYQVPTVTLSASSYDVDATANSGMYIQSRATDNSVIRDVRIYRVDDWTLQMTNTCNNNPFDCTTNFYPTFSSSDAGKTYTYEARATDAEGNTGYSSRITVHVRGNFSQTSGNQMPGVYLDRGTVPEQVGVNSTVHIRADGWDNEGVSRVSVYVTRQSYIGDGFTSNDTYQFPFSRHCYTVLHNLSCTLDIANFQNFANQNFYVWAEVIDTNGQRAVSNIYSMRVGNTSNGNISSNDQLPGIYIDPAKVPSTIAPNQGLSIRADGWDNEGLSRMSVNVVPRQYWNGYGNMYSQYTFNRTCDLGYNTHNATCTLDISNFNSYIGQSFDVWADVLDTNGHRVYSQFFTFTVGNNNGYYPYPIDNYNPSVAPWVETQVPSYSMQEDKTTVVTGRATSQNGIWGMEVRALPSWSNETISRTCILTTTANSVQTCSLTIGPFTGHAGQSVKVWTIAWDNRTGMGGSSDSKTISVTARPVVNNAPVLNVSASSSSIPANQTVTFKANTSDENGIKKIDMYVNARVVKTCTGTTTCEVSGSYPKYSGTSVSYGAKVWDKTGKSTWSGYQYVKVTRASQTR